MTDNETMNQLRENLHKSIKILAQSLRDKMDSALEQPDKRTEMKTYEIKIHTIEWLETPNGSMQSLYVKSERTIDVDSFKDVFDYVQKNFVAKDVTIAYLKIKEIS